MGYYAAVTGPEVEELDIPGYIIKRQRTEQCSNTLLLVPLKKKSACVYAHMHTPMCDAYTCTEHLLGKTKNYNHFTSRKRIVGCQGEREGLFTRNL